MSEAVTKKEKNRFLRDIIFQQECRAATATKKTVALESTMKFPMEQDRMVVAEAVVALPRQNPIIIPTSNGPAINTAGLAL